GRNGKAAELVVAVALADAEVEPAVGEEVERRRLLREQHRVVPGQDDDGGAEPKAAGARGKVGEQVERRRDLGPAAEVMLDDEARAVAERVRLDAEFHVIVKSLAHRAARARCGCLGAAEQSEAHPESGSDPDQPFGAGWMLSTQCTSSGFSTTGMSRFTTTGSWPLRTSTHRSE